MRSTFSLDNPDDMQATMTFTMKLGEWNKLRQALSSDKVTECDIRAAITDLVLQAGKTFYHHSNEGGDS